MAPSLMHLPPETLLAIAGYLNNSADYMHLSRSHRSIGRRLNDREVVTKTIKVSILHRQIWLDLIWRSQRIAGHSKECGFVTSNRMSPVDALHRLYDRQQALSEARPASTLVLGDGQSFVYRQGLVAYLRDDLIRVLDVHNARRTEIVIYTSKIGTQLLGVDCKDSQVKLLHLQDGLLTVIYHGEIRIDRWTSWILVIDVMQDERLSLAVDLWTSEDVAVRNDRRYVCIIAPTGLAANRRHREWVCHVWDTDDRPARPPTLQIPELAINEVGQALVFEVYDGFLYAISTQSSREIDEPEWLSYYTCFRFPLSNPDRLTLESIKIWRRHHREGPINDLWTDLQLVRDETTGLLTIIEARKEWTRGSSTQRRTWYRQRLPTVFSDRIDTDNKEQNHSALAASQPEIPLSSSIATDSPYLFTVPPKNDGPDHHTLDPAASLDQPPPHPRLLCNTHPEYPPTVRSPSSVDSYILAKSKYRTYISSADTFLDLVVDDRRPSSPNAGAQQLRLRIGSRKEASPLNEQGMIHSHFVHPCTEQMIQGSELRYEYKGIRTWPPADAPAVLLGLLNGSTDFRGSSEGGISECQPVGDITAISDERSIVYLVKEKSATVFQKGKLILINFDQHAHFWHKGWNPDFIDLYSHKEQNPTDAVNELEDQVALGSMAEKRYESSPMEIDMAEGSDNDSNNEVEDEGEDVDGWDEFKRDNKPQRTSENNDLFWCEEFDDDESVDLHWFQEHMALWTDFQKGFSFT